TLRTLPLRRNRSLPAPALRQPDAGQPLPPRPAGLARRLAAARRGRRPGAALRDRRASPAGAGTGRTPGRPGQPPAAAAGTRAAALLARPGAGLAAAQPGVAGLVAAPLSAHQFEPARLITV